MGNEKVATSLVGPTPTSLITNLVDNDLQSHLTPYDQAKAFQDIMDEKEWSQSELARNTPFKQAHISNRLKLLGLVDDLVKELQAGKLNLGIAQVIGGYPKEVQISRYNLLEIMKETLARKTNKDIGKINIHPNVFKRKLDEIDEKTGVSKKPVKHGRGRELTPTEKNLRAILRYGQALLEELLIFKNTDAEALTSQKTRISDVSDILNSLLEKIENQAERAGNLDGWRPEDGEM